MILEIGESKICLAITAKIGTNKGEESLILMNGKKLAGT